MSHKTNLFPPWIINIYKPQEKTSYDVIRHFKKHLPKKQKVGHFGTLDPFATGVLLMAGSGGQRLADYVHEWFPKTYKAKGFLGQKTITGDLTVSEVWKENPETLQNILKNSSSFEGLWKQKFLGEYWQVPPIFSATKHEGRPLHEWAREGVAIKKDPVLRTLYDFKVLSIQDHIIEFEVKASSGTYIRTLFEDMAKIVGTEGVLESLERVAIGPFQSVDALTVDHWPQAPIDPLELGSRIDQVLVLNQFILSQEGLRPYINGNPVLIDSGSHISSLKTEKQAPVEKLAWVLDEFNRLLGLGEIVDNSLKPIINFPLISTP